MIHFYELAKLDVAERARLMRRAEVEIDGLLEYVRPIVRDVRERGDEVVALCFSRLIAEGIQREADEDGVVG